MTQRDGAQPFAIGLVLSRAFGVMTGNPVPVFGLAFLLGALPQQLFYASAAVQAGDDVSVESGLVALFATATLVSFLGNALVQAALVRATGAFIGGRSAGLGECVRTGLAMAVPVVGLTILFVLGVAVGWVLLIVPGVMLAVIWSVSIPALVEEHAGVLGAFGRSRALTKGARWSIFVVFVIVVLLTWVTSAFAALPGLAIGTGAAGSGGLRPLAIVLSLVTTTLTTALWATVPSSLFFTLREWQEGPRSEELADVFA